MLKIEALNKHYNRHIALNQVSFEVSHGSIHGLVGKNGAGKTTLLKTIMHIYKADEGCITWQSQKIDAHETIRNRIYFIPDLLYFSMFDTLSNLAKVHRALYPAWSEPRYQQLIQMFNFNESKALIRFSKGEQRQVAFCLALATMPDLLILDEPFDGLDPIVRHQIKNLIIQDVADRRLTILVSSHNLRELEDFCDAVTLIHKGQVQLSNDIDLLKNQLHKVQIAFKEEPFNYTENLSVLHHERSGNLHFLVLRGDEADILKQLSTLLPVFLELMPLSLEEMFIYETEGLKNVHQDTNC